MTRRDKISRAGSLLLAGIVVIVAFAVAAHAAQTFTTPNAAFISYSLNIGEVSSPITLPSNVTVHVMGCDLDFAETGDRGVGQATLVRNSVIAAITWVSSSIGDTFVSSGDFASPFGEWEVFYLDANHLVFVAATASNLKIANTDSNFGHKGNLTMIW